jgi:sugar-specific transcriptional regulator TrmB
VVDIGATDVVEAIKRVKKELVTHIELNKTQMLKIMRKELDVAVRKGMTEGFKVPDLIGDKCQYSTYANFMSQFHDNTLQDFKIVRARLAGHENHIEKNTSLSMVCKKELDNMHMKMEELKREDARASGSINHLRTMVINL